MNAPIEPSVQVIRDAGGKPAFAVIPYATYLKLTHQPIEQDTIPHEVVARTLKEGITPIRAWREYLQLTQADMAERLGISQSAYAQQEAVEYPRKTTRAKIAKALKIEARLLDF